MRKVSAKAKHRTTDEVISSPASNCRCGDIGGEVAAVGDAGGDEPLAVAVVAAGVAAGVVDASPDSVSAAASASPLAATGSFLGVSSL